MRIARFEDTEGNTRYGIVDDSPSDRVELIEGDIFGEFRRTGRSVRIKMLLAPVDPPNVLAIGLNYRDHAEETGMAIPKVPLLFLKATTSVIGPDRPIVLPIGACDEVDYEAELAIVIGKHCRNVESSDAQQYILGYTCGNDVSARDCQLRIDKQWARGKSFDTFCPCGPWIVTTDQLDPSDLAIKSILNGQVMQVSRTSQMAFDSADLVSFLSKQFTLLPGTLILTGTPSGVGFSRKPPVFLRSGDEIIVEIEGIGQLCNSVT